MTTNISNVTGDNISVLVDTLKTQNSKIILEIDSIENFINETNNKLLKLKEDIVYNNKLSYLYETKIKSIKEKIVNLTKDCNIKDSENELNKNLSNLITDLNFCSEINSNKIKELFKFSLISEEINVDRFYCFNLSDISLFDGNNGKNEFIN